MDELEKLGPSSFFSLEISFRQSANQLPETAIRTQYQRLTPDRPDYGLLPKTLLYFNQSHKPQKTLENQSL